jgi:hypothetical protein
MSVIASLVSAQCSTDKAVLILGGGQFIDHFDASVHFSHQPANNKDGAGGPRASAEEGRSRRAFGNRWVSGAFAENVAGGSPPPAQATAGHEVVSPESPRQR